MAQENQPDAAALGEVNIFTKTREGYEAHIKVTEIPVVRVVATLRSLSAALDAADMEPSTRHSGGSSNGNGHHTQPAASQSAQDEPEDDNPRCPDCMARTEFHRGKGANGKPWAGYFCIETKELPKNKRHTVRWIEA